MKLFQSRFNLALRLAACCLMASGSSALFAQQSPYPPLQNVVQLSANGAVDVQQDLLTIVMNTTRDGGDASAVQTQLKAAMDAALAEVKKNAQPGQLDVRTGAFSLYPRYGRDGKPIGWQGSVELILEGRDFMRISAAAGKVQTLTVGSINFGLSREQRTRVEGNAQSLAIESFKARATDIARGFGFGGYSLREVHINTNDQDAPPRPRLMAMEAKASVADAPVPVEAGKTTVLVTVSGSVQLK